MEVVRIAAWKRFSWLRHGFSTRAAGLSTVYGGDDLNLGFTKDDDLDLVAGNRALFLRAVAGDDPAELATVRQVHGTHVEAIAPGMAPVEADGMMTATPSLMLGILVADCVPVLVADTRLRVVAAIHAGWRGTAAGIAEQGIARMRAEFGCQMNDLVAAIGPSIGPCCYTVGDEVRQAFTARFDYAPELFEGERVNLWEANRRQLLAAGLQAGAVTVVGECTACTRLNGQRKYFSHRAESGFTGRAMGIIGVAATDSTPLR